MVPQVVVAPYCCDKTGAPICVDQYNVSVLLIIIDCIYIFADEYNVSGLVFLIIIDCVFVCVDI